MQKASETLVTEILNLPVQSGVYLAEKLIESLDLEKKPALDKAWKDEVTQRCKEIDEGQVELISSNKAFKQVLSAIS